MRLRRLLGIGALIVVALGFAGMASADGAESPAINACASKFTGTVRIIDPQHPRPCYEQLERPVSWAQQGPPGPVGPAGQQGPAGPPGPAGPSIWAVLQTKEERPRFEIVNGAHTTGVFHDINNSVIELSFDQDVSRCAYLVTPRAGDMQTNAWLTASAYPDRSTANQIKVVLLDAGHARAVIAPFQVLVMC